MSSNQDKKSRKYVKPEIRKVKLDSEVLLAGICKTATGTNSSATRCRSISACTNKNHGS